MAAIWLENEEEEEDVGGGLGAGGPGVAYFPFCNICWCCTVVLGEGALTAGLVVLLNIGELGGDGTRDAGPLLLT